MSEPPRIDAIGALRPELAYRAGLILAACHAIGHPIRIIETARSLDRQRWLWQSGREREGPILTQAMPGGSHHTPDANGQASACDWLWIHADPWSMDRPWMLLGELAEAVGLTWGGRWESPRDYGHTQL